MEWFEYCFEEWKILWHVCVCLTFLGLLFSQVRCWDEADTVPDIPLKNCTFLVRRQRNPGWVQFWLCIPILLFATQVRINNFYCEKKKSVKKLLTLQFLPVNPCSPFTEVAVFLRIIKNMAAHYVVCHTTSFSQVIKSQNQVHTWLSSHLMACSKLQHCKLVVLLHGIPVLSPLATKSETKYSEYS